MRRVFPILAAGLLVGGLAPRPARADGPEPRRPNIIFILADDLGIGDLGCYGQERIRTPQLDRMAAEGRRFTQCYAGSTVCAPSRCALMMGLHTGHCRVRGNALVPLQPEDVTVAEVLKQGGYTTGLIGKWGLGEPCTAGVPNKQGFDEFFGYLNQEHAHNSYPDYLWKNEEKFPLAGNVIGKVDNVSVEREQYSNDLFTCEALAFLDRNRDQPFFLYLAYTLPHANNERGRAEGNGMEVPSDAPYSDESWPASQKNHAAMITRLDGDVGRILAKIRELGLEENTIVFFTSDNGPHKEGGADPAFFDSNGPFRGLKRDLYEGGIRVPLIVRWPGRVPAGTESDHVLAFWDILPTLADLADVSAEVPDGLDGLSMLSALIDVGEAPDHEALYWEFHEHGFHQAARMDDWKAVRHDPADPIELYDLSTDLDESDNIAADHPELAGRFQAYLDDARTDSPDFPIRPRKRPERR